jgi:hypothetical protein
LQSSPFCQAVTLFSVISTAPPTRLCCFDQNKNPHCCSWGTNSTCCGFDNPVCCQANWTCDTINNQCVAPDTSSDCTNCVLAVAAMLVAGCVEGDSFCAYLGPAAPICYAIMEIPGVCQSVVGWLTEGFSPTSVCTWIEYCNGGPCSCGFCNAETYGRCLSLPNICPSTTLKSLSSTSHQFRQSESRSDICYDGTCAQEYSGCCLTCF